MFSMAAGEEEGLRILLEPRSNGVITSNPPTTTKLFHLSLYGFDLCTFSIKSLSVADNERAKLLPQSSFIC
jgi:hypothetical protein